MVGKFSFKPVHSKCKFQISNFKSIVLSFLENAFAKQKIEPRHLTSKSKPSRLISSPQAEGKYYTSPPQSAFFSKKGFPNQ